MKFTTLKVAFLATLLWSTAARAVDITFEDLASGATLTTQYAGLGVVFSPNGFSGINGNSTDANWATNTGMSIVASGGADAGDLGAPGPVSGNILRSFAGWLAVLTCAAVLRRRYTVIGSRPGSP